MLVCAVVHGGKEDVLSRSGTSWASAVGFHGFSLISRANRSTISETRAVDAFS